MDDEILVSPARLRILALLVLYEEAAFVFIRSSLAMSDGNLGANLRKLEDEGYLTAQKEFVGRKPRTRYSLSEKGISRLAAFIDEINALGKELERRIRS